MRRADEHRATLDKLPEVFGFGDAKRELPTKGDSAAMKFLKEVMEKAGVVRLRRVPADPHRFVTEMPEVQIFSPRPPYLGNCGRIERSK